MSARLAIAACAGLALIGAAPVVRRGRDLRIVSSRIALPDEAMTLEGDADAQLVQTNCLSCHSASMIAVQPKLDEAHWAAEVEKMRSVYKAPVSDEDAGRLPAILARQQATR